MKKLTIILGIVICLLIIGITSTFVFSNNRNEKSLKQNYVDDNNDGVCDYYDTRKNEKTPKNYNYIDENNDGICDNRNDNECLNLERHHGNGNGHHYRFNR